MYTIHLPTPSRTSFWTCIHTVYHSHHTHARIHTQTGKAQGTRHGTGTECTFLSRQMIHKTSNNCSYSFAPHLLQGILWRCNVIYRHPVMYCTDLPYCLLYGTETVQLHHMYPMWIGFHCHTTHSSGLYQQCIIYPNCDLQAHGAQSHNLLQQQ